MRPIKFRAWDEEQKEMCLFQDFHIEIDHDGLAKGYVEYEESEQISLREVILMQFTGLKDKNGKEIYEGDVLAPGYSEGEVFEVVFSEGCFCERRRKLGIPPDALYIMDGSFLKYRKLEIIGNIYENPELLKGLPHAHDTT